MRLFKKESGNKHLLPPNPYPITQFFLKSDNVGYRLVSGFTGLAELTYTN
jgi:hypothetical protein